MLVNYKRNKITLEGYSKTMHLFPNKYNCTAYYNGKIILNNAFLII